MSVNIIVVQVESIGSTARSRVKGEVVKIFKRITSDPTFQFCNLGFNPMHTRIARDTGHIHGELVIPDVKDDLGTSVDEVEEDVRLSVFDFIKSLSQQTEELSALIHPWREEKNVQVTHEHCDECTEEKMITDRDTIIRRLSDLKDRNEREREMAGLRLCKDMVLCTTCLDLLLDSLIDRRDIECRDEGGPNKYYSKRG